jgi:hypothetical protein
LTCDGGSGKQPLLEKSFTLSCQEMFAVNHAKIISVYGECNKTVKFDVLLLPTEAPYMKQATGELSVSYQKLIHVCHASRTCSA